MDHEIDPSSMWQTFEVKFEELFTTVYKLPEPLQVIAAERVDSKLQEWKLDLKEREAGSGGVVTLEPSTESNISQAEYTLETANDDDDDADYEFTCQSEAIDNDISLPVPVEKSTPSKKKSPPAEIPRRPRRQSARKSLPEDFVSSITPKKRKRKANDSISSNIKQEPLEHPEENAENEEAGESLEKFVEDQTSTNLKAQNSKARNAKKNSTAKGKKSAPRSEEKPEKDKESELNSVNFPDDEDITENSSTSADAADESTKTSKSIKQEVLDSVAENTPPPSKKRKYTKREKKEYTPKREKKYPCKNCKRGFDQEYLLLAHQQMHDQKPIQCPHCPKEFTSRGGFISHVRMHFVDEVKRCQFCDYMSGSQAMINAHMRTKHERNLKHLCDICGTGFVTADRLRRHHEGVHSDPDAKHNCDMCSFTTHSLPSLKTHKRNKHAENASEYICNICGTVLKYKQSLIDHQRRHFSSKNYQCSLCSFTGICEKDVRNHIRRMHMVPTDKCNICGKVFRQRGHLQRHMVIHTGKKDYACKFCSYRCNVKGNLSKHMKQVHSTVVRLRNSIEKFENVEEYGIKVTSKDQVTLVAPDSDEVIQSVNALPDRTPEREETPEHETVVYEQVLPKREHTVYENPVSPGGDIVCESTSTQLEHKPKTEKTVYQFPVLENADYEDQQYEHIVYVQPGTDLDQLGFVDENGQQLIAVTADS